VSQALRELAESLDTTLFERQGRQLVPTADARQLMSLVEEPMARLAALPELLGGHSGPLTGIIQIAASTTIARYLLPPALASLRLTHPDLHLQMRSGNSEEAERRVADGEADVGFIEGPATLDRIAVEHWRTDELQVIAPADFDTSGITPAALHRQAWVGRERGSGTRAVFEHALALAGHSAPRADLIMDEPEGLLRAVAAGAGLAYVTGLATGPAVERGDIQVLKLEKLPLQRPLWRIHQAHRTAAVLVAAFEQALDTELAADNRTMR